MKVYIGPYKDAWIGPYHIAGWLKYIGISEEKRDALGDKWNKTWLKPATEWIFEHNPFKKRQVSIHIDKWDTWGMDTTLALLIVPMLKQLKETKHCAPHVEDADVPEHLRSTSAPPKENEWDTDEHWFKRFEWVLDEMIWGFSQLIAEDSDGIFFTDNPDYVKGNGTFIEEMSKERNFDHEGYKLHHDRITNATVLFGKYYRGLWD